jgi:4-amino-4-deoxy-L-arabinose transferase-like glycosyltransferase
MLVAVVVALLQPREDLLGGNSVGARSATVILPAHTPLCVPDLRIPAGTGQVRFNLSTRTELLPALEVVIHEQGGRVVKGSVPHSPTPGHGDVSIPVPRFPSRPEAVAADVCLIAAAEVFAWGNDNLQANVPAPTLGGAPQHNRVAVWFLGPAGQQRSILSQLGEMFRRAALFRAGFVGAWTYWLLFVLVLPALAYGAIRLLANAEGPRRRRVPQPVIVGAIAFGVAASWALVTPAFQSPDESEHFAYAQYFAETGRAVETAPSTRPVYSDSEGVALEAVKHDSVIELADARPPWLRADERQYDAEAKALGPKPEQDNGGGFHPATSPHTPAYYSLLAPAYFLTRKASPFSQLLAMRLTSALMGALTAVLAMLIVGELLPGRRALACAAGLLVAFAPMFGFISGAVNNDDGVNLATALIVYLVVRSLRRGLTPALGVALGAAMVAGPLLKGTAYELYPPVILGLLLAMLRKHSRRELLGLGSVLATFAVLQLVWSEVSAGLHHTAFTTPGGSAPGTTLEAFHKPKTYISWLLRVMLPFKPSFVNHNWTIVHWPFFNIYIERGFASFGWYAIQFPQWVYVAIVGVVGGLAILGLLAAWQRRRAIVRFLPELIFLLAVPVVVICAVEAAFEPSLANLPVQGTAEQGRYLFPAITAVAALAIGACLALGRRRALGLATALVAGLIGMTVASQLLTLSAFYT